ncbi:MAG: hypothetical protein PHW18_07330 [Sulfuricurvum sp.]|uniref:TolB family protein n=1 Tax=Sulfuricurvum sp. TaxID=2025608 RepID=UPI00262B9703|nr:DUF5050 domain-containing protein [Sulfuricurvum sp.]MDD2829367.1 hypothetical protein [Sulfuricurvum sp.]MDD4949141.1 hypothetical protein [Sulfuricurvum sp.]
MKKHYLALLVLLISASTLFAADVFVHNGDIFYRDATQVRQLTTDANNSEAILSHDGKKVAYVHTVGEESEIWMVDINGHASHCLVRSHTDNGPKKNLTNMNTLMFSYDDGVIYFLSEAWATSNAVYKYDLHTHKQSYITDGNDIRVLSKGKYAGYLVVNKHEYVQGGGSVDRDWLMSPSGRKIRRWNH